MADRPILYTGAMVRACLDGRKTMTRRLMPHQEELATAYSPIVSGTRIFNYAGEEEISRTRFAVGDRLWAREAWRCNGWATDVATIFYRASEGDGYTAMCEQFPVLDRKPLRVTGTWRPGIHMPRWASRLTQVVTEVRVERLQDISKEDAIAEGIVGAEHDDGRWIFPVPGSDEYRETAVAAYAALWDHINGAGAWAANPWCCAITFDVIRRNIDEVPL